MACLSESWYVSLARSFVISIYLMMAVSHEVMNELSDLSVDLHYRISGLRTVSGIPGPRCL